MEEKVSKKASNSIKTSFTEELEKLVKSEKYDKIIKLTTELHNDMDLGKAIRSLVISDIVKAKKPFTDDYIQ